MIRQGVEVITPRSLSQCKSKSQFWDKQVLKFYHKVQVDSLKLSLSMTPSNPIILICKLLPNLFE